MSQLFRKAAFAAVALASGVALAQAETPAGLNFGVISTEASVNQKKNWEPFIEAMAKATGLKIKAFYATDYAAVIEGMRFNKVHVAWYGNKSGIEAVDRSNGEVVAQVIAKDGARLVVRPSTLGFDDVIVGAAARVLDQELGIR